MTGGHLFNGDTERLAALLEQKLACLKTLCALGEQQHALIGQTQLGDLLTLLHDKQRSLDLLRAVDTELQPYWQQDPQTRRWPQPQQRARCQEMVQACERLLAHVMLQEQQSLNALSKQRDEISVQLVGLATASDAAKAYEDPWNLPAGGTSLCSEG